MYIALDSNGNRLYADDPIRYKDCFCQECGEIVKHKQGNYRQFFSHMPNTKCVYNENPDNKSEWHIRMQNYFPKETRERRFVDEITGEVNIADVYIEQNNTVLEFQHSQIDPEEFEKRTSFYLREGKRIVWLFDETSKSKNNNTYGRFKMEKPKYEINQLFNQLYKDKVYRWLRNPRQYVLHYMSKNKLSLNDDNFSICVYTGTEGDVFHKLINYYYGFDYVTFSIHNITMCDNIDVDEFFVSDNKWLEEEPFKSQLYDIERKSHLPKEIADKNICSISELWNTDVSQMIVYNIEEHKCYLFRESKYNKGKMMTNYNNVILYQYVDWNFLKMICKSIYPKFYPLNNYKSSRKIWILVDIKKN